MSNTRIKAGDKVISNAPEGTELSKILFDLFRSGRTTYTLEEYEQVNKAHDLITLHTQKAIAEVIGEDETDDMTDENTKPVHVDWPWRNELRAEQRARAQLTSPTEKEIK